MTALIVLFIILYIIMAVLVVMGYIFYQTRIKHERVDLSYTDDFIFMAGLFWPISAVAFTFWLICHLIYTFFDWFAKSLEEEEK